MRARWSNVACVLVTSRPNGQETSAQTGFSLYMSDNIMENTFYFIIVCTILTFTKTGAFSGRKLTVHDLKSKITFNGYYLL